VNDFVIIEEVEEFECVKFYSVRLDGDSGESDYNEFEKFNLKFTDSEDDEVKFEFDIIINIIEEIGDSYAKLMFFREENKAFALPPNYKTQIRSVEISKDSKLRLYCVLVSEEVVILCNGGWKTENRVQDCPNVSSHFRLAGQIAKYIEDNRSDFPTSGKEIPTGEENGFYL